MILGFGDWQVVLPDLACLRIAVYEESGRLLGHRVLPVTGLCPGYRHLSLRSDAGQPLNLSTLFVNIMVKGQLNTNWILLCEWLRPNGYYDELWGSYWNNFRFSLIAFAHDWNHFCVWLRAIGQEIRSYITIDWWLTDVEMLLRIA